MNKYRHIVWAFCFSALLVMGGMRFSVAQDEAPSTALASSYLRIIHLNVGQADATLIIGTNGKTLLFDAGLKGTAKAEIVPVLRNLGVEKLDYLMVSHYDKDHINGVDSISSFLGENTKVFDRGEEPKTNNLGNNLYATYRAIVSKHDYSTVEVGFNGFDLGSGVVARVVAVNGKVEGGGSVAIGAKHENAASVALYINYGSFDYLVAGDLTSSDRSYPNVEAKLAMIIPDVDIYRVSHHGSPTSSSDVLLESLRPEVAVISVGFNKGYMLPKKVVLERLAGNTAVHPVDTLYLTNIGYPGDNLSDVLKNRMRVADGHVTVFTDGSHYFVNGQLYPTDGK